MSHDCMTVWLSSHLAVCGDICGDSVFGDATQEWCPRSLPCPAVSGHPHGVQRPCSVPKGHQEPRSTEPLLYPCPWDVCNTSPLCLNGVFICEWGGGLQPRHCPASPCPPAGATVQQALPAGTFPAATLGMPSSASWALQGSTDHGDPTKPHTLPGDGPPGSGPGGTGWPGRTHRVSLP